MKLPHPVFDLQRWILEHPYDLDDAIRQGMPKTQLQIGRIPAMQAQTASLLGRLPTDHGGQPLHEGWASLDHGRRSAACNYEWARWIAFTIVYILPILQASSGPFWHVIVADRRWRCHPNALTPESLTPVRRKLETSIAKLRALGFSGRYYAVFEVCAAIDPDGTIWFEPHFHVLVAGSTKSQVQVSFDVRQPKAERGIYKALRIVEVPRLELGHILGYLTKRRAQTRSGYFGSDGRIRRRTNRMSDGLRRIWCDVLAEMPIRQLFAMDRSSSRLNLEFAGAEMRSLIQSL